MKIALNRTIVLAMLATSVPASAQELTVRAYTQQAAKSKLSKYLFLYDDGVTPQKDRYIVCDAASGKKYEPSHILRNPADYTGNQNDFRGVVVRYNEIVLGARGNLASWSEVAAQISRSDIPKLLQDAAMKNCRKVFEEVMRTKVPTPR